MERRELYREKSMAHQHAVERRKNSGRVYGVYGRKNRSGATASAQRSPSTAKGASKPKKAKRLGKKAPVAFIVAIIVVILIAFGIVAAIVHFTANKPASTAQKETTTETESSEKAAATKKGEITLTLAGDENTVVSVGEDYIEAGCHAVDTVDGDITTSVVSEGSVDTSTTGDYTVTYTVTDSTGQTATAERTVTVTDSMDEDTTGISVMAFEDVYDESNPPEEIADNATPKTILESELSWLTENEYYFPSYEELKAYADSGHSLPVKSVVLTFDVCDQTFMDVVVPLLEEYKVPATCFVNCSDDDAVKLASDNPSAYVSYQSYGCSLNEEGTSGQGNGGSVYDMTLNEITADLVKCKEMLGTSDAVAFPYNDETDDAAQAVSDASIVCGFGSSGEQVHQGDDVTKLSRLFVGDEGTGTLEDFQEQIEQR